MATERKNTQTRREEALIVAMTIIHKEGIHNLTLRRVAEGLGISEAALFRHFKDKEDLIDLLASKVFDQYMVKEPEDVEDLAASLLRMMKSQFASFQERPEATSVLFQEDIFREYPAVRARFDVRRHQRADRIARMIKNAQARGQAGTTIDPEVFALIYMGAMRIAVLEWRSEGCASDLVGKADTLHAHLVRILREA
ncbi:MAG: TetR/AcrR family transcriptional regulator [Euryarchaeota archaeon]|nr:TetR/AcrR family transcriptional regulator [Euryarchaeota archaeon]